jgi:hypothetical protein
VSGMGPEDALGNMHVHGVYDVHDVFDHIHIHAYTHACTYTYTYTYTCIYTCRSI